MAVDNAIFSQLYRVESPRLRAFLHRLSGPHSAQDLTHDAFLGLLTHEGVRNHAAYLQRAARNAAFNHLRHLRQGVEVDVAASVRDAVPDRRARPEEILAHRQELGRLLRAITSLAPRRREVFLMSRFEELTYDQIAGALGISRNTVMVHIANALADLHEALS